MFHSQIFLFIKIEKIQNILCVCVCVCVYFTYHYGPSWQNIVRIRGTYSYLGNLALESLRLPQVCHMLACLIASVWAWGVPTGVCWRALVVDFGRGKVLRLSWGLPWGTGAGAHHGVSG